MGLAPRPRQGLLATLAPETTAEIMEHLDPEKMLDVCQRIDSQTLSLILDETSPDVAAEILNDLPSEQAGEILDGMKQSVDVLPLFQHPGDTAGGVMTPEYPMILEGITAPSALDQLRIIGTDVEDISSVFVMDSENKLVGSLNVTRLALSRSRSTVGDLAKREAIAVDTNTDQKETARIMQRYNLSQLPVIDVDGKLVGVVLSEDMVDVVEAEATEDMFRMASVPGGRIFGQLRNCCGATYRGCM